MSEYMQGFPRVKITGTGHPNETHIFLDDKEVAVTRVEIVIDIDLLPIVKMEFPAELEISDDIEALVLGTTGFRKRWGPLEDKGADGE